MYCSVLFKIGPSNGQVQTSKVLDREDMGVHHLYIQAADGGTPTRYDYANVSVDAVVFPLHNI